jgi:hypothetical protein
MSNRELADSFLKLYHYWFDQEHNAFHGLQEIAERYLDEWCRTGTFPETHGIWILFENKFEEYLKIMTTE